MSAPWHLIYEFYSILWRGDGSGGNRESHKRKLSEKKKKRLFEKGKEKKGKGKEKGKKPVSFFLQRQNYSASLQSISNYSVKYMEQKTSFLPSSPPPFLPSSLPPPSSSDAIPLNKTMDNADDEDEEKPPSPSSPQPSPLPSPPHPPPSSPLPPALPPSSSSPYLTSDKLFLIEPNCETSPFYGDLCVKYLLNGKIDLRRGVLSVGGVFFVFGGILLQ